MFVLIAALILGSTSLVYGQNTDTVVVLQTEQGPLVIEFFPEDAPNHVANFIELSRSGFYDNILFHRIIPGFMIQGGDPHTKPDSGVGQDRWGMGGPDTTLDAEFNDIMHNRGIVSMARSSDPNSAGSQFFIVHQDSNFLDASYTVFGRLATAESYETLDAIAGIEVDAIDRPVSPDLVRITSAQVLTRDQVADIQDMDPPLRMQLGFEEPAPSGEYTSEIYNFSIKFPEGWVVQDIDSEGGPNLAAVSSSDAPIPPSIAVYIEEAGNHTLNTVRESKLADVEAMGDSLQIVNHELTTINNFDAFVLDATGIFDIGTGPFDIGYREVTIVSSGKIYTFLFSSVLSDYDSDVRSLSESLDSFTVLTVDTPVEEAPAEEPDDTTPEGGGCLIATAAFGSELSSPIQQLRELRDETLMQTDAGYSFVTGFNTIYYTFSPSIADYERENPLFRDLVRLSITPMIHTLSILTFVDMNSDIEVVVYGVSVILLTLLIYVGPPILAAILIRRRVAPHSTSPKVV